MQMFYGNLPELSNKVKVGIMSTSVAIVYIKETTRYKTRFGTQKSSHRVI